MGMSEFYGETDDQQSLAALRQAFDLGYRHFDTADMYGQGHNETLLGRFVASLSPSERDQILLASKGGIVRMADEKFRIAANGAKNYLREACHASLRRLGVEHIDLYYLHRIDAATPIEESVAALEELRREGKIGGIGLSEADRPTIDAALKVAPIAALQSEYSLWTRDLESEILPRCNEARIAVVAFSPLGRGFLSAKIDQDSVSNMSTELDLRTRMPRFAPDNLPRNRALVEQLAMFAARLRITPAQLALSWLLNKNPAMLAIPGSKTQRYLQENFSAMEHPIDAALIAQLDALFAPESIAGGRYPANIMKQTA